MQITDLIPKNKLEKILELYSGTFDVTVALLDRDKRLLFQFPDGPAQTDLLLKPLNIRDSLLGFIAIPSKDKAAERYSYFIQQNLSEIIEMGFEIESLSGEVATNYEELNLLWKISSRLGAEVDIYQICKILADEVMNICPLTNISIMLIKDLSAEIPVLLSNPDLQTPGMQQSDNEYALYPIVSLGADVSKASRMILRKDSGLIGYVFDKKEPVTVCDVSEDKRFKGLPYPVKSILLVPLIAEGNVIGAIVANDKLNGEEFYSTEIKFISSIASECAIAVKKASLFDEIKGMLFNTAEAFSFAIDAKDPYTYGHSRRVSQIAVKIAKHLELTPDTVDLIRLAALLHDIGKIGTPEEILRKVEELTPEEMMKIREHPLVGARMLWHIQRLREIAHWICHHHEKYDGSGYPTGIERDNIPLPSRIITIADTFDALTSDRPYRKAFTKQEALKIMRGLIGVHFDPAIFEYFDKEASKTTSDYS